MEALSLVTVAGETSRLSARIGCRRRHRRGNNALSIVPTPARYFCVRNDTVRIGPVTILISMEYVAGSLQGGANGVRECQNHCDWRIHGQCSPAENDHFRSSRRSWRRGVRRAAPFLTRAPRAPLRSCPGTVRSLSGTPSIKKSLRRAKSTSREAIITSSSSGAEYACSKARKTLGTGRRSTCCSDRRRRRMGIPSRV